MRPELWRYILQNAPTPPLSSSSHLHVETPMLGDNGAVPRESSLRTLLQTCQGQRFGNPVLTTTMIVVVRTLAHSPEAQPVGTNQTLAPSWIRWEKSTSQVFA